MNGSLSVSPTQTMIYTITVRNSSGYRRASAKVTVKPALPTVIFNAAPDSIIKGQSSTLSWTTGNATTVAINQGIGTVALNGTRAAMPSATTTYTITVTGSGGTVTAAATVTVNAGPPEIAFSASPSTIQAGQGSTLNWTTVSATSVTIEPGIGATELNGSAIIFPAQTTIYTLTATGLGGTASSQVEVQVQDIAPTVTLIVNPASIQSGETATMSWTSSNADSALLDNGIGAVELNGSLLVAPTVTTTYAITVTGPGGTHTATATLTVFSGIKYYAYIPDATDKKLRIVDTDTGLILKTIDVIGTSTSLQGVAAESSDVYTYVADAGTTRIIRIDPLTMAKVGELPLAGNFQGSPRHLSLAQDGCFLYATSSVPMWNPDQGKYVGSICTIKTSGNTMSAVRGVNVELPSRISLEGLAVSSDNARLFVADPDSSRILVLDTAKLQQGAANMVPIGDELIATIPLTSPPLDVVFSSDGQVLYAIANSALFEIDAQNLTVSRSLIVPGGSRFMKVHPDGSKVYVATGNYLSIVETAGLTKTATVSIPGLYSCSGLDVHPDGSRLFLVDKTNDRLITAGTNDYQVLLTTSMGTDPTAYGGFLGHLPITLSGTVTQDGSGLSGVTMTLDGEGVLRTKQTAVAGDFLFGLKPGDYQLTPTMSNLAFTPENMNLHVTESQAWLDFEVSGVVPPPTVTLSSSSTWVKQYESFTLTWDSIGADYVKLEMVTSDRLPPSGSRTFALTATLTIWAVAYNRGGSASASVKVYVYNTDPPTATIGATPTSILQGGSATLNWSTTKATTVTIDNGIGTVAASGSKVIFPNTTTTYTITANHSSGYQVTASTTITVSLYDTSAVLTGTVADYASSQRLSDVTVSALDASGVSQTVLTGTDGKYAISGLRVGEIAVSFAKSGYDPYQQTINIPANTTFNLTTQLHQTPVGATLRGVVKDGKTNLPLVGAMVSATFNGGEAISCTSTSDGIYVLESLPVQVLLTITASSADYYPSTIQNIFSQNAIFNHDFTIYPNSAVATINGTIFNSKNMQPETEVLVSHQETGKKTNSDASGKFILEGIPFGSGSFYFHKDNFINKIYSKDIEQTVCQWDVFEPMIYGKEIKLATSFSGNVLDSFTQQPIQGALVQVIGRSIQDTTDENGQFSLLGIDLGSCNISVTAAHYSAYEVHALIDNMYPTSNDFQLYPISFGTIKGKITGQDGAAIHGVQIGLSTGGVISARTGYDGLYEISALPLGVHTVNFFHPCFERASQTIVLSQEGETHDMTIFLEKRPALGKLNGRVIDGSTKIGIPNASVSIVENSAITMTNETGGFSFVDAPLGIIRLAVEASGYLPSSCERFVEVQWDNPGNATIAQDIDLEKTSFAGSKMAITNETEPVSVLVEAARGGVVSSPDGRLELLIAPNMLPVGLRFSIAQETEDAVLKTGDMIPLQESDQNEETYALGATLRVTISAAVEGGAIPDFKFPVVLLSRYSQFEVEAFGGAEETACFYFNNGIEWRSADIVPSQHFVDPYNNTIGSLVMLDSREAVGQSASSPAHASSVSPGEIFKIFKVINGVKWLIRLTNNPPLTEIIYDKDRLNAVTSAQGHTIPNPNALPLLVFNGLVPKPKWETELPDPNVDERYNQILKDLVNASNGVYRPVFISYNTAAHIDASGLLSARKLHPKGLGSYIAFKGVPADPDSETSGQFPHVDTFGFSMGGLISRFYSHFTGGYVKNMLMLATPNHGTLLPILDILGEFGRTALIHVIKLVNPAIGDLLDYPDNTPEGFAINPKLAFLNWAGLPPTGDISLWAGTDFNAYPPLGLALFGVYGDNDSIVPVTSVYCRPTADLQGNGSLLEVKSNSKKYEYLHPFTHENVGTSIFPISNFEEEIRRGLSDWVVCRRWESTETPLSDNYQLLPTATQDGEVRAMVTLEYNVWDGYDGRTARDIDRAVVVIYYKDALGEWHIAESDTNQNGADPQGNVNDNVDFKMSKTSKDETDPDKKKVSAIAILKANPAFGESGYIPGNDVKEVRVSFIPLKPGQKTVSRDPTSATFGVPE